MVDVVDGEEREDLGRIDDGGLEILADFKRDASPHSPLHEFDLCHESNGEM